MRPRLIGTRVAVARLVARLTQCELAGRAGVSQPVVSRIESGATVRTAADHIGALALALGTSSDELLGVVPLRVAVELVRRGAGPLDSWETVALARVRASGDLALSGEPPISGSVGPSARNAAALLRRAWLAYPDRGCATLAELLADLGLPSGARALFD